MIVDVIRRADLFEPAVVKHRDAVTQFQSLFLIVSNKNRRHFHLSQQRPNLSPQVNAGLRVEGAEGFIEKQYLRLISERPRDRYALLLSA